MMLGFRRHIDIVKSLEGAHPAQPERDRGSQEHDAADQQQAKRMGRFGVEIAAKDDADHRRRHHQRHAQSADHRQAVQGQRAGLICLAVVLICHSNIAFYLIDLSAGVNCAFCSSKRQA